MICTYCRHPVSHEPDCPTIRQPMQQRTVLAGQEMIRNVAAYFRVVAAAQSLPERRADLERVSDDLEKLARSVGGYVVAEVVDAVAANH